MKETTRPVPDSSTSCVSTCVCGLAGSGRHWNGCSTFFGVAPHVAEVEVSWPASAPLVTAASHEVMVASVASSWVQVKGGVVVDADRQRHAVGVAARLRRRLRVRILLEAVAAILEHVGIAQHAAAAAHGEGGVAAQAEGAARRAGARRPRVAVVVDGRGDVHPEQRPVVAAHPVVELLAAHQLLDVRWGHDALGLRRQVLVQRRRSPEQVQVELAQLALNRDAGGGTAGRARLGVAAISRIEAHSPASHRSEEGIEGRDLRGRARGARRLEANIREDLRAAFKGPERPRPEFPPPARVGRRSAMYSGRWKHPPRPSHSLVLTKPSNIFNAILSVAALGVLFYILEIRKGSDGTGLDLRFMPAVNASLNALSAVLLSAGYVAIRNKAVTIHRYCMTSAFASPSLFLGGYLAYHFVHGDTRYTGPVRGLYLLILASHVVLSIFIVPLALTSAYFALKRSFRRHAKVARVTLPLWLYVSVTGVVIFFMLRGSTPAIL